MHGVWVEFSGGDAIVKPRVAVGAERYEIAFLVAPESASELNVVYFKILDVTTMLATPTIAIQNSPP